CGDFSVCLACAFRKTQFYDKRLARPDSHFGPRAEETTAARSGKAPVAQPLLAVQDNKTAHAGGPVLPRPTLYRLPKCISGAEGWGAPNACAHSMKVRLSPDSL